MLIEKTLNLKLKLQTISNSKSNLDSFKQEENDYILLYQSLELQLSESRKVFFAWGKNIFN